MEEAPEKDLKSLTLPTDTFSEKKKNEAYGYSLNTITSAPAAPVDRKADMAAADIALRKTEVLRTIYFKSDSLTLVLYDNGTVDGDTVSVVLNDEVVIPKQGLSEQAYRKVIRIRADLGDSLQLVMYAENLGSFTIPAC